MSHWNCQHCGWSNSTTYQGLRTHQGKKGCTPKGMGIPESEQCKLDTDTPRKVLRAAEDTMKETNKSAFQTPPHYSTTHQTTGNARRALDFSTGAQQFGRERETETEMEKEREAPIVQRRSDFSVDSIASRGLKRSKPALFPPTMELLNMQSLTKNKAPLIKKHILDKRLDFMCLTETWHKPWDCFMLDEACPPGYKYMEKARSSDKGGGLAIMYRAELNLSPLPMRDLSSMECLAFTCESPYSMTVLLIYRPPKVKSSFVPEIRGLLTALCAMSTNIIIVGDFNIHVDNPSRKIDVDFLRVLKCLGLQQHVKVPTHTKGHTLDLVIADSASISNLQVYDLGVSDHKVVSMDLTIGRKRPICFRYSFIELKRIPTFAVDVKLDPTTAHPCLVLSPDGKMMRDGGKNQNVPDTPQRFDIYHSVLGLNRLTSGKSYWEVEVSNKMGWVLGVARHDAKRKGRVWLNPDNGYWVTVHYEDEKYAALTVPPVSLSLTEKPQKVGVFVDYEEGLVSFYDVVAKSHIYSFTECSFGGGIFPYFSPQFKQKKKNSHPLIISAVVVDA